MTGGVLVVTVPRDTANVVVVTVTLTLTDGTKAASGARTNVLGNAIECIVTLLTTSESSTLVLELIHGHSWQGGGAVVRSLVMMNLVDRHSSVDNVGLDSLLLDYRLNGLMDMVVNVLTTNGSCRTLTVSGVVYLALILETSLLIDEIALCRVVVSVIKLAVLNSTELSSVLFRKDFAVLDGLDCAVIVVLVYLLVNSSLNLLMDVRFYDLVLDSRSNSLVDGGVVVSRLGHEVGNSCLSLIHCEGICRKS